MTSAIQQLARKGVEVSFLVRALSSLRAECEDGQTPTSSPSWSDDHVPDVFEFVDGHLAPFFSGGEADA